MSKLQLNALWVGGTLSYLERLCLTSAVACGHSLVLYTYHGVSNVPAGVDLRDGREIMPEHRVLKARNGSYALGADLFRYYLLAKGGGCWCDCDFLFLRPVPDQEHIFGFQDETTICNGLLRLPKTSPTLHDILRFAGSNPVIAPWWRRKKKTHQWFRWALGASRTLEQLEWGIIGPAALSYFARRNCIIGYGAAPEVFYPNNWKQAADAFDPDKDIRAALSERTITVHLWNERIKDLKLKPPPTGSFIDQECRRLGITMTDTS